MTRRPFLYLSVCLVFCSAAELCLAQSSASSDRRESRSDLVRTRRVGHLLRDRGGDGSYRMTDVWDHQTYVISPAKGLDLDPYIDRYVALHGRKDGGSSGDSHQFRVEKVIDLDSRRRKNRPLMAVAASHDDDASHDHEHGDIRQAQHVEIELPSEVLEPGLSINPIPMNEMIDIPLANDSYLEPAAIGYGSDACAGCDLQGWSPRESLGNWLGHDGSCCGPAESLWIRAEYLSWWTDGLRLPPLVTTSPVGTARPAAGVLGIGGTQALSPVSVNNDNHSGLRIRAGTWIDAGRRLGIGGDFYGMNDQVSRYSASSTGNPILARPFFDALNGQETAELVAFPGVIGGTVVAEARNEFRSAGIHVRFNLCCADWSSGACGHSGSRLDGILGYRYARLGDDLVITENLTSQDPLIPGAFQLRDFFDTENDFHGGEVGVQYQRRSGRWMFEALSKLALGNNHQVVTINGSTRIVTGGIDTTLPGGILAQRTNSGRHVRDEFAVIPEVGLTVGYQLTARLSLTLGYSLVYFSNVVRAGDQIDLDVNPNLFPPEVVPFAGPLRPQFAFRETDFWAQGFSAGADFRW